MHQSQPWWKNTVIYHVYPRSFQDSNGDGLGDLKGITSRLQYIRDLVGPGGALWMGPVFRSPQVDNGYDISDYRDIDPVFGTLRDMDELIQTAHDLGIHVLLDLVFNHTSNQHPWFQEAVRDPNGEYADYYIWADPPAGRSEEPPNDWWGFFSTPAWTYLPELNRYYLHLFTPEQPDLNWENPRVRSELAEVANFWLDRGVDGFRMDVINLISKKPGLPSMHGSSPSGFYIDGPKVLTYLQEFRGRLRSDRPIVLVGETPGITSEAARAYTLPENKALDMVLLFDHLSVDHGPGGRWDPKPLVIPDLKKVVSRWHDVLKEPAWPSLYLSNHDQPRVVSRYGNDREFRFESATALAAVFYLQRGTPIVYQGDEIGMKNFPLESPDQLLDIESLNAYRHLVKNLGLSPEEAFRRVRREARDNGRTPMQWSSGPNAGFISGGRVSSETRPWFPVNPDYLTCNVEAQDLCGAFDTAKPSTELSRLMYPGVRERSILCFFRGLFALRLREPALLQGSYDLLPSSGSSTDRIFAFARGEGEDRLVVAAHLSDRSVSWDVPPGCSRVLLSNYIPDGPDAPASSLPPESVPTTLKPWHCLVLGS